MIPDTTAPTNPPAFTAAELHRLPVGATSTRYLEATGEVVTFTRRHDGRWLARHAPGLAALEAEALEAFAPVPAPDQVLALPVHRGQATTWRTFRANGTAEAGRWELEDLETGHREADPGTMVRQPDGRLVVYSSWDHLELEPVEVTPPPPDWTIPPAEVPAFLVGPTEDLIRALARDLAAASTEAMADRQAWWIAQVSNPGDLAQALPVLGWNRARAVFLEAYRAAFGS